MKIKDYFNFNNKGESFMIKMPRGTQDILPQDSAKWRYIENRLHTLMELYNYKEIRTPIFESTELLQEAGILLTLFKRKCIHLKIKGS